MSGTDTEIMMGVAGARRGLARNWRLGAEEIAKQWTRHSQYLIQRITVSSLIHALVTCTPSLL